MINRSQNHNTVRGRAVKTIRNYRHRRKNFNDVDPSVQIVMDLIMVPLAHLIPLIALTMNAVDTNDDQHRFTIGAI